MKTISAGIGRTLAVCFFLGMVLCFPLPAQAIEGEGTLAGIDSAARSVAVDMARVITAQSARGAKPTVFLGSILHKEEITDLGLLWIQNLIVHLADFPGRNYTVVDLNAPAAAATRPAPKAGDYVLDGELIFIGDSLRLFTRLNDAPSGRVHKNVFVDFGYSELLDTLMFGAVDSSGIRRDSLEPDSREDPVELILGGDAVERTIHEDDEDWFYLEAGEEGILTVWTEGELDTVLELYDGDTEELVAENDDSDDDVNARIEYFVTPGRSYLVKAAAFEGESGVYSISAYLDYFEDEWEPNDGPENAYGLSGEHEEIAALFGDPDDQDWYAIRIPAGGRLLRVWTGGDRDTEIGLYDAAGNQLATDDDSGDGGNASVSFEAGEGTVLVRVIEYEGLPGLYYFNHRLSPVPVRDAYEPDDTMEEAKEIRLGSAPQERNLSAPGDMDWVFFRVAKKGSFGIRTESDVDTYLELYDAEGEMLGENDDWEDGLDSYLDIELEAGTYYLAVYALDEETDGDSTYELSVATLDD